MVYFVASFSWSFIHLYTVFENMCLMLIMSGGTILGARMQGGIGDKVGTPGGAPIQMCNTFH